ncbi:MAG: histidine phosphatase family protein [Flexilinea sp.]
MTKFILLRHGQTDWNVQRLYQGQTDIPLNETGLSQAETAAEILKDIPFDIVYCSDLIRAVETAKIALSLHNPVPIIYDARIRERHFGTFEGTNYQRDLMNPGILEAMDQNPLTYRFPGGESLADLEIRAREIHSEIILEYPEKTVLIVSHGSFLTIFACILTGEPIENRKRFTFMNAEPVFME